VLHTAKRLGERFSEGPQKSPPMANFNFTELLNKQYYTIMRNGKEL
jgi:hypothetical protein